MKIDWREIVKSFGYSFERNKEMLKMINYSFGTELVSLYQLWGKKCISDGYGDSCLPDRYYNQAAPDIPPTAKGNVLFFSDRLYYMGVLVMQYFTQYSSLNVLGIAFDVESAQTLIGDSKVDLFIQLGYPHAPDVVGELFSPLQKRQGTRSIMWAHKTSTAREFFISLEMDSLFDRDRPLSELLNFIDENNYTERRQVYYIDWEEMPTGRFKQWLWAKRHHIS